MTRVLESVDAPGEMTKYIDQVVREAPADIRFTYFSWAAALFGRYDVFHVHWPEFLIRSSNPWAKRAKRVLFRLFLMRLKRSKIPVIRTQHNLTPHERGDKCEARLLDALDELTTMRVNINSTTPVDENSRTVLHGHYQDQFAQFNKKDSIDGRFVFFGRIEPYKGVPELIDVFAEAADPGMELRVVGSPTAAVREQIGDRTDSWAREDVVLSTRLEIVPDAAMVDEICAAEALILPYTEMHNSGVLLVSLSLGRPAIVPRSDSNQAIADEVGPGWIVMYDGPLTLPVMQNAIAELRAITRGVPRLDSRDWKTVAEGYAAAFRDVSGRATSGRKARVFVNVGGQRDNLGDSLLRRAYLDALRPIGEVHAYAGSDSNYASGLGLQPDDVVYTSPLRWLREAVFASLLHDRTVIAFNTGEVVGTRDEYRKGIWQTPLGILARLRGRTIVVAGVSVRPGTSVRQTSLTTLSRLASIVTWRDAWTRDQVDTGTVQPDWAFALGGDLEAPEASRTRLAITMRGDRPMPSAQWVAAVRRLLSETGVTPLVVVQVHRDADRARELARLLDAEILEWPASRDHATHEAELRAAYRTCIGVVADRIHALIVGATEGAAPLGFSTGSPDKIVRSLSPVFVDVPFFAHSGADATQVWLHAVEQRARIAEDVSHARREVEAAAQAISRAVEGRRE